MSKNETVQCKSSLPLFGLMLALGIIIASYILGNAVVQATSFNDVIKVRGFATEYVKSDLASWSIYIETNCAPAKLKNSYKQLDQEKEKVIAYLKSHKIDINEISVKPINISEKYKNNEKGYRTEEIHSYGLSMPLAINTANVYNVKNAVTEINGLMQKMGAGVKLNPLQPSYSYLKANDKKANLLKKASENARERAMLIAQSGGSKLGAIKAARLGSFKVMASTANEEDGYSDTSTINKKITAVVTIDYSVEK